MTGLVHAAHKTVDVRLAVTSVTALNEVLQLPLSEATRSARELEGPQEVVNCLEVRANGRNLVDKVLDRDDTVLAKVLLDHAVVRDRDALTVDLGVTALVNELANRLQVRLTVRHVRLNELKHLLRSIRELHKAAVVNLAETQQLHDLLRLRRDVADTAETNNEGHARLGRHVEVTLRLGQTALANLFTLGGLVLVHVLFGTLENNGTLLLASLSVSILP